MPPKIILNSNHTDYIPPKKKYYKYKEFIQSDFITNYIRDRDRLFYKEGIEREYLLEKYDTKRT